jgi:putative hemolysin
MFNFSASFINQQQACMEMGRSFIVKAHQHSFYGLLLLWKGIGAFVCQNPQYRILYGTVSLSKLYDPRSVTLINKIMVTDTQAVQPKIAFENSLHPELASFLNTHVLNIEQLSVLVKGLEQDAKDIPVLLKQYHKLGAVFHCLGIDGNFNTTPGLLLSVDLPKAPDKLLKLYLGAGKEDYLAYQR